MSKTYTGFQIQDAIRKWKQARDILTTNFQATLFDFPDSERATPKQLMDRIERAERAMAELQTLQQAYSLKVKVELNKEFISLALAVKLLGGYTRANTAWLKAAKGETGTDKYSRYAARNTVTVKKEGETHQIKRVSDDDALNESQRTMLLVNLLRAAIAKGNTEVIEVTDTTMLNYLEGANLSS